MLHVAAPLGLLALAGLVVPIALHLIRRPRQTVHVGSLQFVSAPRRRFESLRWREPILLAVRCLLLAALALLVAGASWRPTESKPVRWLLLAPGTVRDETSPEWNRLRAAGFEVRQLAPGFERLKSESESTPAAAEVDAWSLLREADSHVPAGSQAVVFGPTPAAWFRGTRPELSRLQVTWIRVGAPPAVPQPPANTLAPARIAVVADSDRAEDARYLRAAIAAAGALETNVEPAWIFQLGAANLPPALMRHVERGAVLVNDAPDTITAKLVDRFFNSGTESIRVRQRVPLVGAPLLADGTGEPLLIEKRVGPTRTWQWALRFHPDWTDWPTSGAFPAWWRDQWAPRTAAGLNVAPEQAAPGFVATATAAAATPSGSHDIDLRAFCWWTALALFVMEYWLRRGTAGRRSI